MSYQEFISYVTKQMQLHIGGESVVAVHSVRKNNGIVMKALSVKEAGRSVCPLIYLAPFYRMYLSGRALSDILQELVMMSRMRLVDPDEVTLFFQFREASKHLAFRIINIHKNREILAQIPHRKLLDFAVIYYLSVDITDGRKGSAVIYNDHLEMWGVSEEVLFDTAMQNTPVLLPLHAESLDSMLEGLILRKQEENCLSDSGVFVLTNRFGFYGAAAILYKGALKELSDALGGDLYLLPSSIHEFLVLPVHGAPDAGYLEETVRSVNIGQVAPEEVLSDHIYRYDSGKDCIVMA